MFKRIADKALKNIKDSENPSAAKKEFEVVFSDFIKPLIEGEVDEIEVEMKKTSLYITEVGEKSIEFRKNQGESKHSLSIATLKKMYDNGSNDIISGGLQHYYNPILELLLDKGKSNVVAVQRQNYVIIIDEINRANISRVFGELITLIEKDKRSHGKIPLTATLPSGDSFIVPSNLYIIGTMNTADKSIALLDIALRRRFQFIPMYPDSSSTSDKVVHDAIIMDTINKEIIDRKGHDFTIGHSYFMGDDYELKDSINNKVLPLLLEYFMNDYDEVKKICAAANLNVDGWPMQLVEND
ncbi:AAA_5 ATPase [Nonlabens ulvanivorans]|uniref:AAA_5 ATPase n=1 Tax=Nonlabens ulvanivorans TaxID=906888 RepID=A0A090WFW8_NONUL|nr:AAA family ATPase [Nonlabens ulvanivorans]GAL74309.1 AAA_5 ATPase [Nonlabens ulvanivorans]